MLAAEQELGRLLGQPEDKIDLGRAALVVARTEYPDLDVDAGVARLDEMADQASAHVSIQPDAASRVSALRAFLAGVCGFRGNEEDYYDPKNSFLNDVLERRLGIPITLSVVYMEVGRRLGMTLFGVGLPGHFLVKYQDRHGRFFLDPFRGGRSVTSADCREMITRMYQGQIDFQDEFLAAVDKRYILMRMLNNLRGIYFHRRQPAKALAVVEMVLAIEPASGDDLKQRGILHYQLHNYRQAREDLEAYLFLNPEARDSQQVKQTLAELKKASAMLN